MPSSEYFMIGSRTCWRFLALHLVYMLRAKLNVSAILILEPLKDTDQKEMGPGAGGNRILLDTMGIYRGAQWRLLEHLLSTVNFMALIVKLCFMGPRRSTLGYKDWERSSNMCLTLYTFISTFTCFVCCCSYFKCIHDPTPAPKEKSTAQESCAVKTVS